MKHRFAFFALLSGIVTVNAQNYWGLQGSGTEQDPFQLSEAAHFYTLAEKVDASNTAKGQYFIVTEDIDFGGTAEKPAQLPGIAKAAIATISDIAYGFDGVLDGNGKTIKGIYHTNSGSNNDGKFNALISSLGESGVVKNLIFAAENHIESNQYIAPFVSLSKGSIIDCVNKANVKNVAQNAGGICALMASGYGQIIGCRNQGNIESVTFAAGILAFTQSGSSIVTYNYLVKDCINEGDIKSTGTAGASGIVAAMSGRIENCNNYGDVYVAGQYAAGIVSTANYAFSIENCNNYGTVTGNKSSGGIVGNVVKSDDVDVEIKNCENSGAVVVVDDAKGVAGSFVGGIVGNSARVNGVVTLNACTNKGLVSGGDETKIGNLRGAANISIGDNCVIADGLPSRELDVLGAATKCTSLVRDKQDGAAYGINGVRVNAAAKGLFVKNGRLFLVK